MRENLMRRESQILSAKEIENLSRTSHLQNNEVSNHFHYREIEYDDCMKKSASFVVNQSSKNVS